MVISKIWVQMETLALKTPFKTALREVSDIENVVVYIQTDTGLVGRGAAAPTWVITGDSTFGIVAALKGPIQAALIQQDAKNMNELLEKVQASCVNNFSAKAAADMALHDLFAQFLNQPLYQVLGGTKNLTTSMTIGLDTPNAMQTAAKQAVADGFGSLKIKVGHHAKMDIERMQAIHEVIPNNIRLRLDANQGWSVKEAIQTIRELERLALNIDWVEQPVKAHDVVGLKTVHDQVGIAIMADESVFSARDALGLLQNQSVDLLNIKLMKCGGIAQARRVADLAAIYGVKCMVGSMMESSISVAAAAHFAASHHNVEYCDLDAPLWLAEAPQGLEYEGESITLVPAQTH